MMATNEQHDVLRGNNGGSTPIPDPTVLTTEALRREVAGLKELVASDMFALRELLEEKISTVKTQLHDTKEYSAQSRDSLAHDIQRSESLRNESLETLRAMMSSMIELRDEKLNAVRLQFDLMEQYRVEQKHDTQAAVDAALAAAKEAVQQQTIASDRSITKSETATSEQLKQMNVTTSTAIQGINLIIDDVKERISRMESFQVGARSSITEGRDVRADSRGTIAIMVAVASVFLTLVLTIVTGIHLTHP